MNPSSTNDQLQPPPSKRTGLTPRAAWILRAVSTLPVTLTTATRGSATSGPTSPPKPSRLCTARGSAPAARSIRTSVVDASALKGCPLKIIGDPLR